METKLLLQDVLDIKIVIPLGKLKLDIFGGVDLPGGAFKGLHKFFASLQQEGM